MTFSFPFSITPFRYIDYICSVRPQTHTSYISFSCISWKLVEWNDSGTRRICIKWEKNYDKET